MPILLTPSNLTNRSFQRSSTQQQVLPCILFIMPTLNTLPSSCPILELGCGPGSTPLLHAQALLGRLVVSADTNLEWCDTNAHKHDMHVFMHVEDPWTGWDELFRDAAVAREDWSIVFIDHWPSVLRPAAMRRFRNSSACVLRATLMRIKLAGVMLAFVQVCHHAR